MEGEGTEVVVVLTKKLWRRGKRRNEVRRPKRR
jgi:hypothetical protein